MKLPVRLSAAQTLLEEKVSKIESVYGKGDEQKERLLNTLRAQKESAEKICINMLHSLGYGGTLQQMERDLNKNIKELQHQTYYLNGEKLEAFMIGELSKTIPYDPQFQARYMEYLQDKIIPLLEEEGFQLTKEGLQKYSEKWLEALGFDEKFKLTITNDGSIQGFNRKGGSTPKFKITENYVEQTSNMRTKLSKLFPKTSGKIEGNTYLVSKEFGKEDEKLVYSLLRLRSHGEKDKLGLDNLQNYETIFQRVKFFLVDKIKKENNNPIFHSCVDEVFSNVEMADLFAGENAPKKLTGLLGEIQALFFIRSIIKEKGSGAQVKWAATNKKDFSSGKQPHADLLLKSALGEFGIQVKNTTLSAAQQEISFQSFKSKLLDLTEGEGLNFQMTDILSEYVDASQDDGIFEAISTILMMYNFNIPYIWKDNKASEATIGEVKKFESTRLNIENYAKLARKVLNIYAASLMYMQLTQDIKKESGARNSLYIIGGALGITSASILIDIINKLEDEIQAFSLSVETYQKNEKNRFEKNITIVDFLNHSGTHDEQMYIKISSSYNFSK